MLCVVVFRVEIADGNELDCKLIDDDCNDVLREENELIPADDGFELIAGVVVDDGVVVIVGWEVLGTCVVPKMTEFKYDFYSKP